MFPLSFYFKLYVTSKSVNWIQLAQNVVLWRFLFVNMAMKLWITENSGLLSDCHFLICPTVF